MSAILDVPAFRQRAVPMTVERYHQMGSLGLLDKRTELIRGHVFNKLSKSPLHMSLSQRLYDLLSALLPEGFLIRLDGPLTLRDSEPEPDLAVVKGRLADFWQAHPSTADLVVEIAVTTLLEDREMAAIYAEAGVQEYWIVSGARSEVEVHREPQGLRYQSRIVYSGDDIIECASLPQMKLRAGEIFAPGA